MAMGDFTKSLRAFENKAGTRMKSIVQKIGMEAFKRVIEKSPVDTGRFRANWGVQIGSPYTGTINSTDKSGRLAIASAQALAQMWNGQGSIFLCNNVPYSIPLEYGHSKQAPGGMVRTTVAEIGGVVSQVVNS